MKKLMMMFLCALVVAPCVASTDGSNGYDWPPPTGIGRGIVNIVTSPCEIVRDISYYGGRGYEEAGEPGSLLGGIFGIIPGAVMTIARIGDGVLDCFTLGIWGNAVSHTEVTLDFFPMFAWEDIWLPESLSQE